MLIFLDEDRAYLSWLSHHRRGFVLDGLRKPTKKTPTLHRASCAEIRRSSAKNTKKTHWTSGRHLKACSLILDELAEWARMEYGADAARCESCMPAKVADVGTGVPSSSEPQHDHLTRLGRELLDYVIESAVIHLDQRSPEYNVSVGDAATYLDKTPAQLTSALLRLVEDEYLSLEGEVAPGTAAPAERAIHPTVLALKQLPAFEALSDREIQAELDRL